MAEVLLFHHALGLTDGLHAFADELRAAGHGVSAPDLYDGRTFASIDEGVAHASQVGFQALMEAGAAEADGLPSDLVYAGFSLGVVPAQRLAQERPGARGALLYHAAIPLGEFGDTWPPDVPMQVHVMAEDELGDVEEGRQLVADAGGELFLYDGAAHLFTDRSWEEHDPEAAALVMERTLAFLDRVDRGG